MQVSHEKPVIIILGATATGKTFFSYALADYLSQACEIISVDSAMIYRGMDIGTAKPSKLSLGRMPHHLIDICDPRESYSVASFVKDAHLAIARAHACNHIPILVGGTMMYHAAFQFGLAQLPEADTKLRASIEAKANQVGWHAMHGQLALVDPDSAVRIHPNDSMRITRALEVHQLTGKPISMAHSWEKVVLPYKACIVKLENPSRSDLHQQITKRFDDMLQQGLVAEVRALLALKGIERDCSALRSVGYKQVVAYLDGDLSYSAMRESALAATRQFAKRQITWQRRYFSDVFTLSGVDTDAITRFTNYCQL